MQPSMPNCARRSPRQRDDRPPADLDRAAVANRPVAHIAAHLPLFAILLGLCDRGLVALWGARRLMAGAQEIAAMPPLGRVRHRSGSLRSSRLEQALVQNQRSFVLAIALSLLAFVAWTFVSSRYFPATAPVNRRRSSNASRCRLPTPESSMPNSRASFAIARIVLQRKRPRRNQHAARRRFDQPEGRAHRRSRADPIIARRSPRIRLRCACCRPTARPGPISRNSAGRGEGAVLAHRPTRSGLPISNQLSPGQAGDAAAGITARASYSEIMIAIDRNYHLHAFGRVSPTAGASADRCQIRMGLISRVGAFPDISSWTLHTGPIGAFGNGANRPDSTIST
jgi:hypothetical protein